MMTRAVFRKTGGMSRDQKSLPDVPGPDFVGAVSQICSTMLVVWPTRAFICGRVACGRRLTSPYATSKPQEIRVKWAELSAEVGIRVSEEHRPALRAGCMSLKLLSRASQLRCGPTKIRGTTWLGS